MAAELRRVPLAELSPGTRLAGDLVDAQGETLLTAGTVLDARLLERLAGQGIASVPVGGDDVRAGEIRARLERRFAGAGTTAASRALLATLLAYRLERPRD